ncbi:hypothetical protein [Peptostreptococcus equinus]|uniref:Uncharacterized protein n=1 Tax=Peptostreptococcus equinus TaxID=3003601 RepID=A0ABY7JRB9_9FIRM|nr:hypothetical protein [Peptostreptococcus sp. CBA3647]WAW14723.1 hypothetical protein O0R46_09080 [Peptostreptococcus sp. CBA3647]
MKHKFKSGDLFFVYMVLIIYMAIETVNKTWFTCVAISPIILITIDRILYYRNTKK